MTDYSNACVYKIVCKDESITDIYIGSTKNFKRRGSEHKSCCNNKNNKVYTYKLYKFIRDNGGWENWDIIKICDVKCLDNYDLHKKEGEYMRSLKPTLNKHIAGRTKAIYTLIHKEEKKIYDKKYREQNKGKIKDCQASYRAKNKEKINKLQRERYARKKSILSSEQV